MAAQMWRTTILAQCLYGCEIWEMSHEQLRSLCAQGESGISNKVPLELSNYCAAEAVCGPPLGACAVRDPRLEVATRRMRWLVTLANQVGLVGIAHRHLATLSGPTWVEPSVALSSTLKELRWTVVNGDSMRASRWPHLDSEPSHRGEIHLEPQAASPRPHAVWTDDSNKVDGGVAAVQLASQTQFLRVIKWLQSSTQCQLVALSLVVNFRPPPSLVSVDSLNSLQILR